MTQFYGTPTTVNAVSTGSPSIAYDTASNKVIIGYQNNSGTNTEVVVGTVSSDGSIVLGTPIVLASADDNYCEVNVLNGVVVVAYADADNADKITARAGTVTGTGTGASISFGSALLIYDDDPLQTSISIAVDPIGDKFIICWEDNSADWGGVVACTLSGTTISKGSFFQYYTGNSGGVSAVNIGEDKYVIYYDVDTAGLGYAKVATLTGTAIAFGSAALVGKVGEQTSIGSIGNRSAIYLGNDKVLFSAMDYNTDIIYCVVGSISGSTITYGDRVALTFAGALEALAYPDLIYLSSDDKFICSALLTSDAINIIYGTVTGTVISQETALELPIVGDARHGSMCYDSDNGYVIFSNGTSSVGNSICYVMSLASIPPVFWTNFKDQSETTS